MKRYICFGGCLAALVIVALLAAMVMPLANPIAIKAAVPNTPYNESPIDGAIDISLTWTLRSSDFSDPDVDDTHYASQWQIREDGTPADFSETVFDSGITTSNLAELAIPTGTLINNIKYYWRVRYQDDRGEWSNWSTQTSFTTWVSGNPGTPSNILPANGATDIALTPTLQSSAFSDPDEGDTHAASQWQMSTSSGDYSSPVLDSGVDVTNKTSIAISPGTLSANTTYYWHVRHRDSNGLWSAYSTETSFTTMDNQIPNQPSNTSPDDEATDVGITPTLYCSTFSDPDSGDTWANSEWQITIVSSDYSSPVFQRITNGANLTHTTFRFLHYNTSYYWRVRHQDNNGNWSSWSTETSFTTITSESPNVPVNISPGDGATDIVLTPTLRSSAYSNPNTGETHAASQWQLRITSGTYDSPVYDSGTDTTNLSQITIPSGTLSYDTTYYWHVKYQDSDGDWSLYSEETSFTIKELRKWTFMVYLDADNNLESAGIEDFNEMEIAGSTSDVNIVVLMDRIQGDPAWDDTSNGDWTGTKLFYVTQDFDPDIINSVEIADWWEQNMGHPNTLEDFATWAIDNYPADNYALVLWDHGNVQGVCLDETSDNDYLDQTELKQALRAINSNTGEVLDILTFEACLMGMAEIDYQIRDYASIRVGSEEVMQVSGLPYDDILEALAADPDMTPEGLTTQMVNDYNAYFTPAVEATLSAVDLSYSATLAGQVSELAQSMMNSGEWDDIALARADAEEFYMLDYSYGHYADLYHFAQLVQAYISDATAKADAQEIMDTIDDMVIAEAHGMLHPNSHGISIYFPELEGSYAASWYSYDPTWVDYCENMSFAADTQWNEFLLAYCTAVSGKPLTPSNVSPANGASNVSLVHEFRSSDFVYLTFGEHYASQWQIRKDGTAADYSNPAFDSGVDIDNLIDIEIPSGALNPDTLYWWRVRYQHDTGVWSDWSTETSFTTIASGVPSTPSNTSPINGSTNIILTPTLESSSFASPDGGATHAASQWQISTISGDYTIPAKIYDSTIDDANLTQINISSGLLSVSTTYYWQVRHQDSYGNWSSWSTETSFTTTAMHPPITPINSSPTYGETDISITPTLTSSAFSDPDVEDSHGASQWQIRTESGTYDSPIFDSGVSTSNLTQIIVPSGILNYNTTYYWHVKYQDSYGKWSDNWSTETFFVTIASGAPNTPSNISPADGTFDIQLTPTLRSSAFDDPDADDIHIASRWQIRTESGSYDGPIFDSGVSTTDLTQIGIPSGYLEHDTEYYWHVRYQDSYGNWSVYSTETSFSSLSTLPPKQPANTSPIDGATNVSLTPTLKSSEFYDVDTDDTHRASQWQISTTPGDYSMPVYDSNTNVSNKTSITIPSGRLSYSTTYYWHVRHQDNYENWSGWSTESSFTTSIPQLPEQPTISSPLDKAIDISLTPILESSDFSDPDIGDSHAASQWQISTISGDYSSPVYDSGTDTSNKTSITIPSEESLTFNTTYYWHVRYQDSHDEWSDWSTEASFTTQGLEADFSANLTQAEPYQVITFTDQSSSGITSWIWDFGDDTPVVEWTTENKPETGIIGHGYSNVGTYTVSLTVTGPAGTDTKTAVITISEKTAPSDDGGGVPIWIWIVLVVVVLAGLALLWYVRRR